MSVAAPWRISEAIHGRYYDDDGAPLESYSGRWMRSPRQFGMPAFMRAVRGLADQFHKRVPPEFVTEDVTDETHLAVVDCPCGGRPIVELGTARACDCNRHFYYAGAPGLNGRRAVFGARFDEEPSVD
jgi:hypothetical protein